MKNRTVILRGLGILCLCLLGIFTDSCKEQYSSDTILNDTMEEVNKKGTGYDEFLVSNTSNYFAVICQLEDTPENKAKILWLANHDELGKKFRAHMLENLKEGHILARVVKENKALVLAVQADEIEYHVVINPEEIVSKVFKK